MNFINLIPYVTNVNKRNIYNVLNIIFCFLSVKFQAKYDDEDDISARTSNCSSENCSF